MVTEEEQGPARARGYDEPAKVDVLERRPLARAIADVIAGTPPEFGVRVGLFGEWGSGKTSVLNFVREILEARNHVVVQFSPWGIVDSAELWTKLGQTLLKQFEANGEKRGPRLSRFAFKYDKGIKKGFEAAKKLTANLPVPYVGRYVGPLAAPALDLVQTLLSTTEKRLSSLAKAGERIVVMIDDVDRVDPRLVPPILFALRELFDVPRFSWILAVDPVVVRAALKKHHPGFALGRDFLEKIVDFPFVLREPEPTHRVALVERDLTHSGVQLDGNGLREIAAMLPANPRELRSIVRHLRSIAPTLSRMGPDEVDHRLLLTLVAIHAAAPNLLMRALEEPVVLGKITGLKFFDGDGERKKKELRIAKKEIQRLLVNLDVREAEKARMGALLLHIGEGGFWAAETVMATGRLLHTSPVMTAREASEATAEGAEASGLRLWLERFAAAGDRPAPEVRRVFFDHLLLSHSREMDRASGSFSGEEMTKAIESTCNIVRFIDILLFELGAASEVGAVGLKEMRRAFSQWAHFVHPLEYLPAREAERAILLRFANAPGLDAVDALGQLAPERLMHDLDGPEDEPRKRLSQHLLSVLEKRATDAFIGRLGEENAVASVGNWSQAGRFLLRGGGLLWKSASRAQLKNALEGDKSPARSDNATDLLAAAARLPAEARRSVLGDADLVQLLWQVATAIAPNMRRFKSFAELRMAIEAAGDRALVEPAWWQTRKAQYEAASGRANVEEETAEASGEGADSDSPEEEIGKDLARHTGRLSEGGSSGAEGANTEPLPSSPGAPATDRSGKSES